MSEDPRIVAQRVPQHAPDHASLTPLVDAVEQRGGERPQVLSKAEGPQQVSADAGCCTLEAVVELAQRGIDAYVPAAVPARELNLGQRVVGAAPVRHREHRRMRQKLRDPAGRAIYQRRQAIVEPVFGIWQEQRGMRQFRRRGLAKVAVELALATTAFHLTRRWRTKPDLQGTP